MTQMQPYYPPRPPQWPPPVQPRGRALGAVVSLFLPGVGSMVNGSAGMGIAILVTWIVGVATAWLGVGLVVIAGAWVWGVVDGALSADRWNRAHGIIS